MHPQATSSRPPESDTLISVVLPVYNEACVLVPLVEQLTEVLESCAADYEMIFVNDGSTDESPRLLDRLAAQNRRIRVVHFSRNFGHQPAVHAGLAQAQGDAVILMDSDLQDAPDAIVRFVAEWRRGYDVVYAVRTQRKEMLPKRLAFAAFHRFMARIATVRLPADAGIFGLVDRRVAQEILALGEYDRYFPGLRSWVGFRQKGIEVERRERYDGRPRVSLEGLIRLAKTAIFSFSTFPLRFFYLIGAAAGVVFITLALFALGCRLFTDLAIPGWTSSVLVASFFGVLNALGICILGEYVVRIYDQVRNRPLYLVARTVNVGRHNSSATTTERVPSSDFATVDRECLDLLDEAARLHEMTARDMLRPQPLASDDQSMIVSFPGRRPDGQRTE